MPDAAVAAVAWVVWSALNAVVAKERGRSIGGALLLSLFLSLLLGYLYLVAVPALPPSPKHSVSDRPPLPKIGLLTLAVLLSAGCGGSADPEPTCVPARSAREVRDGCVYVLNISADGVTCSAVSWC